MRNLKKTLALILALAMVMSIVLVAPVGAKESKAIGAVVNGVDNLKITFPSSVKIATGSGANAVGYITDNDALKGQGVYPISGTFQYYNYSGDPISGEFVDHPTTPTSATPGFVRTGATVGVADGYSYVQARIRVNGAATASGTGSATGWATVRFPFDKLGIENGLLQATPKIDITAKDGFTAPSYMRPSSNEVDGSSNTKDIVFTVTDLIPGHEYTYDVYLYEGTTVTNGTRRAKILTGTYTPTTSDNNSKKFEVAWDGYNTNGGKIYKSNGKAFEWIDTNVGQAVSYLVEFESSKSYRDGMKNSVSVELDGNGALTFVTNPSESRQFTVDSISIPTITPGTTSQITATLSNYDSAAWQNLIAVIYTGDGIGAANFVPVAVLANKGSDTNAVFEWDGRFVKKNPVAAGKDLSNIDDDEDGTFVKDGNYKFQFMFDYEGTEGNLIGLSGYIKDAVTIKVNESPAAVHKVDVVYTNPNTSLKPTSGGVVFNVVGSKQSMNFVISIKNMATNEIVYSMTATTGSDFKGSTSSWNGTITANPSVVIEDGSYMVEATASGSAAEPAKTILIVGDKVAVNSISANVVTATVGESVDVPLIYNPTNASVQVIKSISMPNTNDYFDVSTTDFGPSSVKVTGKKYTAEDVPAKASITVEFMDGTKKTLALEVNVVRPASSFELGNTILRQPVGYTGTDNKILVNFTPAGTFGTMPTFTYAKDVDGALVDLEGDELAAAKLIATVAADGTVEFLMPGRVVIKVAGYDKTEMFIICTTTEYAEQLLFFPEAGELSVKQGVLADDPAKQSRVSAYTRPIYAADDEIIFSTSDTMTVVLLYADLASGTVSNKSATVPAGAHAGAFVGLKEGTATLTATTKAKDADGKVLSASIEVTVTAAN